MTDRQTDRQTHVHRRLRFSSDADIVRLTNARIIIIIIIKLEMETNGMQKAAIINSIKEHTHIKNRC